MNNSTTTGSSKTTFSELAVDMVFYFPEKPDTVWRKVTKSEAILDSSNYYAAVKRKVGSAKQVCCDWDN